jgi:hypothetical protein|tara:strand:- start:758 stop:979 length:222 start_codon:yes stop_codon:yes gene_type:complete
MPDKEDKQEDGVVIVPDTYEGVDFSEEFPSNKSSSPLNKLLRIIGRIFVGVIVFGLVLMLSGICNVIPRDVWL